MLKPQRENPSQDLFVNELARIQTHREPLLQRLRALGVGSADFAGAQAALTCTLAAEHWVDDAFHSLRECRALLSTLVDPVDTLSLSQQSQACAEPNLSLESPCLAPLRQCTETLLRLRDQVAQTYPTIAAEITPLLKAYQSFIRDLCKTPSLERSHCFVPSAVVVGDGIDFLTLPTALGLKLLCKDRYGHEHKTNQYGLHAVAQHEGVFYKPNPPLSANLSDLCINPGMEYAIVSLLQLIAGDQEVAAPTAFIKVQHVLKQDVSGEPAGYQERVIQAGLGVPGISFQDLLELVLMAQRFKACCEAPRLIDCYQAFLDSDAITEAFITQHPILRGWMTQVLPKHLDETTKARLYAEVLPIARAQFRSFPALKVNRHIPHLACLFGEDVKSTDLCL